MSSDQIYLSPPVSLLHFPSQFHVPSFFRKFNVHQIHLLLPFWAWVWDYLLENGWPLRARIPEENGLFLLAGMIAPQRGVGLLIPSSIPSVLRFWPA